MIGHELLLLGLLKESPKHGYEIKKKVREILSLFAGVDMKSVYYPLRVLEREGLLVKRVGKEGKRPARVVYALTAKGNSRFQTLLLQSFLDVKRPQFTLDMSLYFLPYIQPSLARPRLRARMRILARISQGLERMLKGSRRSMPLPHVRMVEHNIEMIRAESKFLATLSESRQQ